MKILFDTQIFDWQINGGISRYFMEVLNRLNQDADLNIYFQCTHSYNTYIQNTPWLKYTPVLKNLNFKGKLGLLKLINQRANRHWSNRILRSNEVNIFHPTYYDPYFLNKLTNQKLVLTVHDLTNEKYNDNTSLTQKVLNWKKKLIQRADHIIVVSENTKKDLLNLYKVDKNKITTIYLSGGFDKCVLDSPNDVRIVNLGSPFILYVGSRRGYKNFFNFIKEATSMLLREKISLVLAGGGPLSNQEIKLLQEHGLVNQVKAYAYVSDEFLVQLYKGALLFVFPSLYEGFGLPVLEAMQCGCPALLGNNSSLPEVGGSAAAYFDPNIPGSLKYVLEDLIQNESRRIQMTVAGYKQVTLFSWDLTADRHKEVYRNLL